MKIGILQTGLAPEMLRAEFGEYPDMFERLLEHRGFTFQTFRVVENQFPAGVHDCDGWLITGSRHGAYEDHAWIPPLEQFIRDAFAAHVPVVGVCFGHQIVAQAMGGKVAKFGGGWAVGAQEYDFGGETLRLNAWHQDQVVSLPKGATVVASNEFCTNAALLYDTRAFTVQGHPEYGSDFIDGLMRARGKGVVPDALLADATSKLGLPTDSRRMADRIADFFQLVRA